MPKVSVLIPVYNSEKYIEKCIKSVLSQTLKDIEIIIINDGSIDSSLDIINNFKDDRIKIINKKNSGYGASLNLAIKEAQGEYISILESDDFMDKDMLKKLYPAKNKYDIIKSSFYYYPENKIYNLNINTQTALDDNPEVLNIKPSIWSAIYKRDFLIDNKIEFNETKGASYQDVGFHFKTFFCAKLIKFINKPLYYYRTDNPHSSVKAKNKVRAIINEFKLIDEFLEDKVILPETQAQLILFELKAYIWNYNKLSVNYENEFISLIYKKMNAQKYKLFFKSRYIKLIDKIKLFLLLYSMPIFKMFLGISKKIKNYKQGIK